MRAWEGGTVGLHGAPERVQAAEDALHILFCVGVGRREGGREGEFLVAILAPRWGPGKEGKLVCTVRPKESRQRRTPCTFFSIEDGEGERKKK